MGFSPRVVASERIGPEGFFEVDRVTFADGEHRFDRDVVRHPGAVAVLAFDGTGVVLIRQWRAPLAREILEIPAGTCDVAGEPTEATARRELEEEAGLAAGRLEHLCSLWSSPGWSDQLTHVYLATELTAVPRRPSGPEEAAIEVVLVPLRDAVAMLDAPQPCDATAAVAIRTLAARVAP